MQLRQILLPPIGTVLLAAAAAGAQTPAPQPAMPVSAPQTLTPELRREIVDTVSAHLARFYAIADTGRMIGEHLQKRLAAGAYDRITNPALFAEALTTDLKAINQDRHLGVSLRGPNQPAVPLGAATIPAVGGTPPTGPVQVPPQLLAQARRTHYQLGKVDVLPGNVGYFEIRGFSSLQEAQDAIVSALRYLEFTDALIIDVRDHGGGSGMLSNFLISHFTGPDTLHALTVAVRAANQVTQRYTLANVPGPRRTDVPVYILTSRGTVSAGEDFAFVMKNLGRAILVGETTAGAGRNNPSFDAGHGFVTSISVSTVKDPRTGAEWEGIGVLPNVTVPPRAALGAAHLLALDTIATREQEPLRKKELELAREYVAAQQKSPALPAATLQRYVGVYGGERTITIENGKLTFRRTPERLGQELVPISESTFALGPYIRLTFETQGGKTSLRQSSPISAPLTFQRGGPPPRIASEYR